MTQLKKAKLRSSELQFKVKQVRQLLAHAKGCSEFLPMSEEAGGASEPGIVLVTEVGIYLASNGRDDKTLEESERIVFAEGMDPCAWVDSLKMMRLKAQLVGHQEDAVLLKASAVETMLEVYEDWETFRIAVVHDGQTLQKVLMLPPQRMGRAKDVARFLF